VTQPKPGWRIEFYTTVRGDSPVLEVIKGLQETERATIYHHLRLLRELGVELGMPYARPLSRHKPLWELRPSPYRLLYFAYAGRRLIILHACRKRSNKTKRKDIDIAARRMREFEEREEA
jgi:phage-related protein